MLSQRGAPCRAARLLRASCVALLLGLGACPALAAPKTDVVLLVNGDRITGEIKELEHNQLRLITFHMGTIYIEWDKIVRLESDQHLLLERSDGSRYYGQLKSSGADA